MLLTPAKSQSVFDRLGPRVDNKGASMSKTVKNLPVSELNLLDETNSSRQSQISIDQSSTQNIYDIEYLDNPSPIRVDRFECWLEGYNPVAKASVVHMVKFGVRVPSSFSPPPIQESKPPVNQPSTLVHFDLVNKMILSERALSRVAGLFPVPPPGLVVSPLAAVPKKESNKVRVIHNLSYLFGQ